MAERIFTDYYSSEQTTFKRLLEKGDYIGARGVLERMPIGNTPPEQVLYLRTQFEGYRALERYQSDRITEIREFSRIGREQLEIYKQMGSPEELKKLRELEAEMGGLTVLLTDSKLSTADITERLEELDEYQKLGTPKELAQQIDECKARKAEREEILKICGLDRLFD